MGIDSSTTCPGFCVLELGRLKYLTSVKAAKLSSGPPRWALILSEFEHILKHFGPIGFAVVENYAYSSFELSTLGEMMGILKWHMVIHQVPFGGIAPSTVKKFFTGHGHAKKEDMMRMAFSKGFQPRNDNEADAIALALYGETHGFQELKGQWPQDLVKKATLKKNVISRN